MITWEQRKLKDELVNIGTGKSKIALQEKKDGIYQFAVLGSRSIIGYEKSYDYEGDFVLTARVGENAGRLYRYKGKAKITDNTVFLECKNTEFIFYALEKYDLKFLSFGTGQPLIKASELSNLKIKFCKDNLEQAAIGKCFATLDSLITLHQRKCDKLKNVKKSMLEKMFPKNGSDTPEVRFKGFTEAWEQRKLGEVVNIIMGQSPDGSTYSDTPNGEILVQGNADLVDGWVKPRMWTTQITKYMNKGDLVMSVRAPAGTVGKTAFSAVIGRGIAAIKGNEFIFQTLVKKDIDGYWKTLSCGSTFESLNSSDIINADLAVPKEEEQNKIGDYFTTIDNLITLHQRKCEKLKNLKKSCLERMFV